MTERKCKGLLSLNDDSLLVILWLSNTEEIIALEQVRYYTFPSAQFTGQLTIKTGLQQTKESCQLSKQISMEIPAERTRQLSST